MSQPDPSRKRNKAASPRSSSKAQSARKQQLNPSVHPGGTALVVYKNMLGEALRAFPDPDPGRMNEKKIISIREKLEKVKGGITLKKHKALCDYFSIDIVAVNHYLNEALAELNAVLSLVRIFNDIKTKIDKKYDCSKKVYEGIYKFKECIKDAKKQFARVPLKQPIRRD